MDFNLLVTNIAALFIVLLMVAPLVLLTILVIKTSKKPPTINKERIDALEQNDNIIVEDINAALTELVNRITDLEEKIERDEQTVKGFGSKK